MSMRPTLFFLAALLYIAANNETLSTVWTALQIAGCLEIAYRLIQALDDWRWHRAINGRSATGHS